MVKNLNTAIKISVLFAPVFYGAYVYLTNKTPGPKVQRIASMARKAVEVPLDLTEFERATAGDDGAAGSQMRRGKWMPWAVRQIKAEIGLVKDNAGNRMVIRRKFHNLAVEKGIRPTHIQEMIDIAIELVLLPTETDVLAAQLRKTKSWKERWTEFDWWGGRIAFV